MENSQFNSISTPAEAASAVVSDTLYAIPAADVLELLDRNETLDAVRRAFIQHSSRAGRTFPLIREAVGANAVFGIKAGDIACDKVLGFKAAGFWPDNNALGKGAHQATIVLFDPATGRPVCLLDGNHVTTLRTGAAGAIGLATFARPDSQSLCLFGTGVQAQVHLEYALSVMSAIETVTYLTVSGQPDLAFEQRVATLCRIRHERDADTAVNAADVVITATPSRSPLFSDLAVRPGTHINAVGADTIGKRELPPGLLERSRVFVDDITQARTVGEGQWAPDLPVNEIGVLLPDTRVFARRADDITVFDMTGLALQDLVVAQQLFDKARRLGRGLVMTWPW